MKCVAVTEVDGYWTRPKAFKVGSRAAMAATTWPSTTPGRLYLYDTLLERLAQDFQDVTAELRELIEKQNAFVRQRHLARHGHLAPTDQPDVRNGVVRGATRAGGD
jgi:hypothetical protein